MTTYNIQPGPAVLSQREQINRLWQQDPMQIVLLLFDKSLQHIARARASLTGWGDDSYQQCILKAVYVVQQLQHTLNTDNDNPMAENISDVYRYISRLLAESIHGNRAQSIEEATQLLLQIRESLAIFVKKSPTLLQH